LQKAPENDPDFYKGIKDEIESLLPEQAESKEAYKERVFTVFEKERSLSENENTLFVMHGSSIRAVVEKYGISEYPVLTRKYGFVLELKKQGNRCFLKEVSAYRDLGFWEIHRCGNNCEETITSSQLSRFFS